MNNKLTDETLKAWKTEAMISLGETPKDCRDYSHHEAILALVTELQELRAAMLQGTEPVSQTYNLPELIEGMEVSIDVSTCDADSGNRYFGTVTEVSELDTAKNGYILLVQDAEPNFDVNGNTPVQSPIDHGYRPECECSGCKATARICAELNNEEAEIFADGYNAAMQSFGNSEQLNSPVTPDGWKLAPEKADEDMIAEGNIMASCMIETVGKIDVSLIYGAMLAAAPEKETGPCTK